jgi:PAS domain S-box-containing protein
MKDGTSTRMDERAASGVAMRGDREELNQGLQSLLLCSWAQAVWETDAEGVVVTDSPSWRAYAGQTLNEWPGYGWLSAIHPDDRAYAERQWREAMAARSPVNAEFRLHAPDGAWRWTNVRRRLCSMRMEASRSGRG